MIGFKVKLSSLNSDSTVRFDEKFHSMMNKTGYNIFSSNSQIMTSLKDVLIPYYKSFDFKDNEEYRGIPTGKEYTNEFGDITSYQVITKEEHPNRLKYQADENCILISSLKGAKTPALNFNFDLSDYVFSNGFYIFKVNQLWNKRFILYLLRTDKVKFILDNCLYRGIGISSYKEDDFLKIKIPQIPKSKQDEAVSKIQLIEEEISQLKNIKQQPIDIINKVIGNEFNFSWQAFEEAKNKKIFASSLLEFSNNIDCRTGVRFHNKAGIYLQNFLESKTDKKIKDFISEPIVLGKSVSPKDYDENGDFYYIAMSNIKTWAFESIDCKKVSNDYSSINLDKTVRKNDILLARSGEGTIGKVALIKDEEISGIFADFTQRIRLENFNALCAYYYFRSDFFQYLVYTHKKGLGNNTNIFPSQIREFPMPDWNNKKQTEIVEKIKQQLDKQKEIDKQVEQKQRQIGAIIEQTIANE